MAEQTFSLLKVLTEVKEHACSKESLHSFEHKRMSILNREIGDWKDKMVEIIYKKLEETFKQ